MDILQLFIILVIFLFILIVFFLFSDESTVSKDKKKELESRGFHRHVGNWRAAMPLIALNLLLIIYVVYGFYNVEYFFYNVTSGQSEIVGYVTTTVEAYAYGFYMFFFINVLLMFVCGYYSWMDSLLTKGIIPFNNK